MFELAEYRLEELASATGVSVRNIRAYRERGLLDPPRKVGRAAMYDDVHLAQLETIDQLLRRGFTTAHIAEFFESIRAGHDLAEILGLQRAVRGAPRAASAVTADVDPDAPVVGHLRRQGLVDVVDGEPRLVDPALVALVEKLAGALVHALEASVAERFGEHDVPPAGDVDAAHPVVADYRAMGFRVAVIELERAVNRRAATSAAESRDPA